MTSTRRATILLSATCCIALVIGKHRSRLSSRVHQIQLGMTRAEVTAIAGPDDGTLWLGFRGYPEVRSRCWHRRYEGILIVDFRDGVVVSKTFHAQVEEDDDLITRLFRW